MFQWHTPVPQLPLPPDRITFSRFKESDVIYPLANDDELKRLEEFIDELEVAEFVPKKPYKELLALAEPTSPFMTHVQLYVMTATLIDLKTNGLIGVTPNPSTYPRIFTPSDQFRVSLDPCPAALPRHFPQLSYGLETLVMSSPDGYFRTYHRCCKLDKDHPGCWYGPVKGQITPWVIVAANFNELRTIHQIIDGLRVPIVKGTYWLHDPIEQVKKLRSKLEREIADAILHGGNLGVEYFTLLELTHNEDFVQQINGRSPIDLLDDLPPPPIDDFPGKQYYLEIMARREELETIKRDIDNALVVYDGYFVGDALKESSQTIAKLTDIHLLISETPEDNAPGLEDILRDMSISLRGIDLERLRILKEVAALPMDPTGYAADSVTTIALKKAQVVGNTDIPRLYQLQNRLNLAAPRLGELVIPQIPIPLAELETQYVAYVTANQSTIPASIPDKDAMFALAYAYFLTGKIDRTLLETREVAVTPTVGAGFVAPSVFSTGTQFQWDKESCWFDSVFSALFSMPNSPWEQEIRNATKMYVREWCNATEFRDALIKDMEYLQEMNPQPRRPALSIKYFEACAEKPQVSGKFALAVDTFKNLKALFKLSDTVILRDEVGAVDPNYTTFAAISSRPGHFVPYILQPGGKTWMRIDDLAHESERVMYVPHVAEGELKMKSRDIPGDFYTFTERINFYLDMKTVDWKQMTKFTSRDLLAHWANVQKQLGLIQPIYLNEEQKKIKANRKSKNLPSHNKLVYGDIETFGMFVKSIRDCTFDYVTYQDGVNNLKIDEPEDYVHRLKQLISVFDVITVGRDVRDELSYNRLLLLAVKPHYESMVLYSPEGKPRLVSTDKVQSYVDEDRVEMQSILDYFMREEEGGVAGKVIEI